MFKSKRGNKDGVWKTAVHSLTAAMVILALAASLLSTLSPRAEAADCPLGQVLNISGECVPEDLNLVAENDADPGRVDLNLTDVIEDETPTPQLDPDIVTEEETPTPEVDPVVVDIDITPAADPALPDIPTVEPLPEEPGEGYVTLQKYVCGSDPDPYQKTLAELQQDCAPPAQGFMFGLTKDAGDQAIVQVTDGNGSAFWTIPSPTTLTLNEAIPAGFGDPIVFCGSDPGSLSSYDVTFGSAVSFPLAVGDQFSCDWFNVQIGDDEEESGDGSVTVHKYDCGLDPDAYQKSLDGLFTDCAPAEDVGFKVTNVEGGNQENFNEQQVTDADGLASWTIPEPSQVTVQEQFLPGYGDPIVYCGFPSDPEYPSLYPTNGGTVNVALASNEQWHCYWFNVQTGEADEAGGKILIKKYSCENFYTPSPPDFIDINLYNFWQCTTLDGVSFAVSDDFVDLSGTSGATGPGWLHLNGLVGGLVTVTEEVPPGYGTPFVYCSTDNEDGGFGVLTRVDVQSATVQLERDPDKSLRCDWLNIPLDTVDETVPVADIIVHKYECDEDPAPVSIDGIDPALQQAGCTSMDGVDFTVEGHSSNLVDTRTTGVDGPGTVQWLGLSIASAYEIIETVPAGYGTPISYCIVEDGGDTSFTKRDPNSSQAFLPHPNGTHVECYWINIPINNEPEDDGSITIYKYTCPDGYDLHAPGADPSVDCTGSGNNIEFWLNGLDPRVTGQELESAVTWEGLSTATYTVSEIVPDWVASVFVMSCDGNSIPMIQGYPLSTGPELTIELAAGDQIVCSWYNVPESPDPGTVTVIKYGCAGPVFVSVDECEIYEGGAGFALSGYDGATWNPVSTGYTNVNGVLSFTGLPFGLYQIDELDGEWCHAVADSTDENGYLRVEDAETTVRVYNCNVTVTKLPPTKYPNTGVGQPEASEVAPAAPVLPEDGPEVLDPGTWMGVMDGRLVAPFSASDKPVQISIESIDLSAEIETLEIVDGAFQDPTTSEQVAWYKDTAKLGEDGNLVMAGHLNYWGDPEGVFYSLNQVKEGDEIVVTAEDGTVYRYEVIAVSQQVANSRTLRAITQPTDEPTLTLITCGGEWDPSIQSYLHRTVVRAELIEQEG